VKAGETFWIHLELTEIHCERFGLGNGGKFLHFFLQPLLTQMEMHRSFCLSNFHLRHLVCAQLLRKEKRYHRNHKKRIEEDHITAWRRNQNR